MSVKVGLNGTAVLALVAVAVVGVVVWKGLPKLAQAAKDAGQAVNPLNHDNVFAKGVNAVGGAIVSEPAGAGKNADGSWTFGGWIYDVTHPDAFTFPSTVARGDEVNDARQIDRIIERQAASTGGASGSW